LRTITALGAAHDCIEIAYAAATSCSPVENIELLSRYGSEAQGIHSIAWEVPVWQSRKAKLKQRLLTMAAS
jgi:transcription-repair coupling factor (superfamily II helicase)